MAHKTEKIKPVVVASVGSDEGDAVAVQVCNETGEVHGVALQYIRVVIVPDGAAWFAQGIDIDYASQGATVEEAKTNFEKGLRATIDQHLRVYRHIRGILQLAPPEILANLLIDSSAQYKLYSQVSAHDIHEALQGGKINYLLDEVPQRELVQ